MQLTESGFDLMQSVAIKRRVEEGGGGRRREESKSAGIIVPLRVRAFSS